MQNDMRDRLVELIINADVYDSYECKLCTKEDYCDYCNAEKLANQLIANGVIAIDMNVISPENRPLITQFANTPLDEVCNLIKADVVPVIRCKDCKFFDMSSRHCDHPMSTSIPISRSSTGYCSYGERKDGNAKKLL